jgi:hypothetical protein
MTTFWTPTVDVVVAGPGVVAGGVVRVVPVGADVGTDDAGGGDVVEEVAPSAVTT